MRSYKQLVTGIVIGVLISTGGTVFANSSMAPTIADWVKFKFNGIVKELPSGYTVLSYEGRTYVPARFVAEELGAKVEWNVTSNTVEISKKEEVSPAEQQEPPKSEEVNQNTEESESIESENIESEKEQDTAKDVYYEKIPISETLNGVSVEIYDIDQSNYEYTLLYFRVKNTKDEPIQFVQSSGYLEAEGKQYKHTDVSSNHSKWKDKTWYTDLNEDDDDEGYIMIPKVPNEIKKGTVHVEVLQNDRTQEVTNFDFDLSW